ncbi:hypothetical protein [Pseudomonas quasicaspiana]|nr:hypothetical protein [Pseudomonas quasicaspiana]MCD5980818.1 hypothetical protein [Pseudomonas quasicaspiana]
MPAIHLTILHLTAWTDAIAGKRAPTRSGKAHQLAATRAFLAPSSIALRY